MTDAKKLFAGIRAKRAMAAALQDQINERYSALLPKAVQYDRAGTGGGDHDRTERILDSIDRIKARQTEIVEQYLSDVELAYTVIGRMEDPTEARLLSLKYLSVDDARWCDVADAMNYDERSVYRKVQVAMTHAQIVLDEIRTG